MSLYNMIHGFNPLASLLLDSLKLYPPSATIDRFRDAALYNKDREESDYLIRVLTRTGGSNREAHQESIDRLTKHEFFLRSEDDDFDSTYMYFFFKLPQDVVDTLRVIQEKHPGKLREVVDNMSMKEKTDSAIATMERQ